MLPKLLPIYSASLARDPHLVTKFACRVALFAHNEEDRIGAALTSILNSFTAEDDLRVHVLVNGSTDGTIEIVRSFARSNPSIVPVELPIGDKCNAWNYYVYQLADESPCHFFMDGDVRCPPGVLERMWRELAANPEATVIAPDDARVAINKMRREYRMKLGQSPYDAQSIPYRTSVRW